MTYIIPKFRFQVSYDGKQMGFTKVSGTNLKKEVLEYRHGLDPQTHKRKFPGMETLENITLERGVAYTDDDFYKWWKEVRTHKLGRKDVTIQMLDDEMNPLVKFNIMGAFPVEIKGGELDANSNEFVIESMVLAHDGLTVEHL